jgi:hypothetical protein
VIGRGVRFNLKVYGLALIDADVGGETLYARVTRPDNVPFAGWISGLGVLADDRIGSRRTAGKGLRLRRPGGKVADSENHHLHYSDKPAAGGFPFFNRVMDAVHLNSLPRVRTWSFCELGASIADGHQTVGGKNRNNYFRTIHVNGKFHSKSLSQIF